MLSMKRLHDGQILPADREAMTKGNDATLLELRHPPVARSRTKSSQVIVGDDVRRIKAPKWSGMMPMNLIE